MVVGFTTSYAIRCTVQSAGADPGGAHPARTPPKIGKNMIFWRKIVIFHTKYPKFFAPPSARRNFFKCAPLTWNPGSSPDQCLSPLMLWVRISIRARCTTLCDKVCQWLTTGRWFSSGAPVSSTNKTDRHDITEILLKVALNTIK
jgi:hypothetical protein